MNQDQKEYCKQCTYYAKFLKELGEQNALLTSELVKTKDKYDQLLMKWQKISSNKKKFSY